MSSSICTDFQNILSNEKKSSYKKPSRKCLHLAEEEGVIHLYYVYINGMVVVTPDYQSRISMKKDFLFTIYFLLFWDDVLTICKKYYISLN